MGDSRQIYNEKHNNTTVKPPAKEHK